MAVTELSQDNAPYARPLSPRVTPEIVRARTAVRCSDGSLRQSRYLDYAATAPALRAAADAALEVLPYYGSIHRGGGRVRHVTAAYERARGAVARSWSGSARDRLRAQHDRGGQPPRRCLPAGARVLSSPAEHHANMLPWRRRDVDLLPFTRSPDELLARSEVALAAALRPLRGVRRLQRDRRGLAVGRLATLAHAHGAELFVDPRSSRRTCRSTWRRSGSTTWRSPGTSSTRRSASASLVARAEADRHPPSRYLHGGGAVAHVPSRIASSGAMRRRASRPARRTSSARSRSAPRATPWPAYGMSVLAAEELTLGDAPAAAAEPRFPACGCSSSGRATT